MKKENIYNIPNPISLLRIIISPFLVILIFYDINLLLMIGIFLFAAFTDFLDGFIARRYNQVTNFGRKLDMIADRILMISVIMAIILYMSIHDFLTLKMIILIILVASRELLSFPFLVIAIILKKRFFPHARLAGKLMTTMQAITFPLILMGWDIAVAMAFLTSLVGIVGAGYYVYDSIINPSNKFQIKMDEYYKNYLINIHKTKR